MSPRAIIALERGERRKPYRQTLQLLASALQLSANELETLQHAAGYGMGTRGPAKTDLILPTGFLVGRSRELAVVEGYLNNSDCQVLMFAGEPGVGKSRLLQEAAHLASARGYSVLRGGGKRQSGQQPYAPLLDTLAHSLTELTPSALRAALVGCAWLARLLPELTEMARVPFPAGALPPEQERRLVFGAVARYLSNVAGPAGTLLLLDDLQWSSADGLDLLASLVQVKGETPVHVIGAYRDTEVNPDHPLSGLLGDLAEHRLAEHLKLEPLGEIDAMALLDGLLPTREQLDDQRVKQRIVQRTGGVPFFLVSCVHGLEVDDSEESVPWTVAQSIQRRVGALPATAQAVVRAAAILGREVHRATLVRIVESPDEDVLIGLDAACHARLLLRQSRSTYRFAHDVVRESIEAALGDVQRIPLHLKAAEMLEELPESQRAKRAAELAWHLQEGDRPDRALPYSIQAGDEAAAVSAYTAAQLHYRTALTTVRLIGDDRSPVMLVEAEILEKLSALLAVTPAAQEALELLQEAADIYRAIGDKENEGRIAAQIGRAYYWGFGATTDRMKMGIDYLRAAQRSLGVDAPPRAQAALSAVRTHLLVALGMYAESLTEANTAIELARRSGDDGILAEVEVTRGIALVNSGREEEGLHATIEALRVAERAGDHFSQMRALYSRASLSFVWGRFEECQQHSERALAIAERTGHAWIIEARLRDLGLLGFVTGEWQWARQRYEQAMAYTRSIDPSWIEPATVGMLAWLDLSESSIQAESRHLEESLFSTGGTGSKPEWTFMPWILAERDLLEGRGLSAVSRLEPFLEGIDRMKVLVEVPVVIPILPTLAEAHLILGNERKAEDLIDASIQRCEAGGYRPEMANALRVKGTLLAGRGLWLEAEETVLQATALARILPYPYVEARTLYAFGNAVARAGSMGRPVPRTVVEQAQNWLEEASTIFQRLGARPYTERAGQVQSQIGTGRYCPL